ncbi:MAG: sensor histidine kinase [Phycisphaerales bacterium]
MAEDVRGRAAGGVGEGKRRALLSTMRIRKKLVLLHTAFSLTLAGILLLAVRPAVRGVVREAEEHEARLAMRLLSGDRAKAQAGGIEGVTFGVGSAAALGIDPETAWAARERAGEDVLRWRADGAARVVRWDAGTGDFLVADARLAAARLAVLRVYGLVAASVLGVYMLIALTLEVFVLPRQVYGPIGRLLEADMAVQAGRRGEELIPEREMPRDELGEIMRSRNDSIVKLRRQEEALAEALDQLEVVAMELKRKNHLLETAKRNLADQDRLASLGVMSAGIAHELNTPLAVLKGQVERLVREPRMVEPEKAELMLRVVKRLERLSESLLDFARARPGGKARVGLRGIVEEAWVLVSLDREAKGVVLENGIGEGVEAIGDADRLHQVFVNLLRNAVDAMAGSEGGVVRVSAEGMEREGSRWVSVKVEDEGPGIDPGILPRLFEPFASTRLDARGTGLGLAVSEGIVREHGGVMLARNAGRGGGRGGAVFEVMLPVEGEASGGEDAGVAGGGQERLA